MTAMKSLYKDKLKVEIFERKEDMRRNAASLVTQNLNQALADRGYAILFLDKFSAIKLFN